MPFQGDLKREYQQRYITPYMREYLQKHPDKVWQYHRSPGRLPTQRSIDKYGFTEDEITLIAQHMPSAIVADRVTTATTGVS